MKLNVIIIGSGMFCTGRGTSGFGTILPSVFEAHKKDLIENVAICSTKLESSAKAKAKVNKLTKINKQKINFHFFPNKKLNNYSLSDVIKEINCNCAIISTPDHLHSKFALQLMKLRIHCLVVKPMTNNTTDAKKMIKSAIDNNVLGMVEFHKRYDEANIILKDYIQSQRLGNLEYSIIEYSQRKIIPTKMFSKWINKTNIFQYLAVHYVDLIYYLTNFIPMKVKAWGQNDYLKKNKINNYDSIQVTIEWKRSDGGKFLSFHFTNWIDSNKSSSMSDQIIKIIGEKGKIISDQKNRGLQIITDREGVNDINPYFSSVLANNNPLSSSSFGYGIKSILTFLEHVKFLLNTENKNVNKYINNNFPSFKSSYISTAVLEAVNKSLKVNKSIKVKL